MQERPIKKEHLALPLRLLEVMRSTPEALLQLALSKTANQVKGGTPVIEYRGDKLVSTVQNRVELFRKGKWANFALVKETLCASGSRVEKRRVRSG